MEIKQIQKLILNISAVLGMKIGEETTIYVPTKTQIDTTRPWLISIGNNVKITEGCHHSHAWL